MFKIKNVNDYIYLDWNVVQYLKSPREKFYFKDTTTKELVFQNKSRYNFPYCEAHLRDLLSNFKEENRHYIDEDLRFLSKISDNNVIGINDKNDEFKIIAENPTKLFDELSSKENILEPDIISSVSSRNIKVDMSKVDKEHPFYEMLKENNGVYTQLAIEEWFLNNFDEIYNNSGAYKKYRGYVPRILEMVHNNETINEEEVDNVSCLFPYLELCAKSDIDLEDFKSDFLDSIKSWLLFRYKTASKIPLGDLISTGYTLLDFHPKFKEKLKKNNKLSNIVRDSKHAYFAHKAKYFVSEDENTLKKMKYIYNVLDIKTKPIDMNEFIQKFS